MNRANGVGRLQGRSLSRRGFLRAAGGTALGSAGLVLAACSGGGSPEAAATATISRPGSAAIIGPVEQQRQRRMGTGLTAWDPTKTFDGLTLFAASLGTGAYLVDMEGQVVHTWDITEAGGDSSVWFVDLLENGNLFAIVHKATGEAPPFVFQGGIMMEIAWDGGIVWQFEDPDQHHDARLLANGNLLLLRAEQVPPDIAAQVQGGVPGTEGDSRWTDWVAEVTRDGETVWEWHAWEHLDPAVDIVNPQDTRLEWTHGNSVDQLPNGDAIISFRNINTVVIADRETGEVSWKLTAPTVAQQHDAHHLPNGNILIFDNGAHRTDNALPYSRVIEVDPATSEIVWEYRDPFFMNFLSPFISGAQRLPNGNTLITEGNFGRIFEVTQTGELVWEYVSEFFTVNPILGENNGIFRAFRYADDAYQRS